MIERASCSVEYSGCSRASVTGSSVLQRLPMRRCVGLVPTPSVGVLRQSRRARHSDPPDALLLVKRRLTVLTAFSAFQLDWIPRRRRHMLGGPDFREFGELIWCELGAIVCQQGVGYSAPCKNDLHLLDDASRCNGGDAGHLDVVAVMVTYD